MTNTEPQAGVFGSLTSIPEGLRSAAAILGAEHPPQAALSEAIETVWHAGLTLQSGARQKTIIEAAGALVFTVFDHPQSEIAPKDAARTARVRLSAYMRFDRELPASNQSDGGASQESPWLG